jgi:hypothetical protein
MSRLQPGVWVSHPDYGDGRVVARIGAVARVDFLGDEIDVDADDLQLVAQHTAVVDERLDEDGEVISPLSRQKYFSSIEAINLGVVPPDSEQLLHFTMNGAALTKKIRSDLDSAPSKGLCKVVLGHYGTGKTHYLQLVRAVALQSGWVVSFVEFDPKAADPAKPHLVYRHLMSALEFPPREDGSVAKGFLGFVKEVRAHWMRADIRHLPLFSKNPWLLNGLHTLLAHNHDEDDEHYVAGCSWLAGDKQLSAIRGLAREAKVAARVPSMPASKEAAEIYAFHLAVVDEILKQLGYKGLLLILDEAEHVRGYSVRRQERANNFFDYLARCAHPPMDIGDTPALNEHGYDLPDFWKRGPLFGLYVGLTPAFGIPQTRDECVFIRSPKDDLILTQPPSTDDYRAWADKLFQMFHQYCPHEAELFSTDDRRARISAAMVERYAEYRDSNTPLRNWIKLGGFACSVPLVDKACNETSLIEQLTETGEQIASPY